MYRYESCQGQNSFLYIERQFFGTRTIFNAKEVLRGELGGTTQNKNVVGIPQNGSGPQTIFFYNNIFSVLILG